MPELGKRAKTRKKPPAEPENDLQLERKRTSVALFKLAERALTVSPRDVDVYAPREFDLRVAEAMLAGAITFDAIAQVLEVDTQTVSRHLRDPLVCAWVSRVVHTHVQHRLGLVDAAMLSRAMAGDARAARLLYDRYGQMVNRSVNVNVSGRAADFAKFDDADLDALIEDANKHAGITTIARAQDPAPAGDRGEEEAP